MFRRLLIANRGEIALRIARACRKLGIEPVAVHSEADRGAPWLEAAARTVCIGPSPSEGSYLDAEAILQAAVQTDCHAVHPGYGFLSENATFAARCEQHGLTFVGPGAGAILRMGDKIEAKRTMSRAGIPTIPGPLDAMKSADEAARVAASVGYPILLKAAAGGGGKGMRRCDAERGLRAAWDTASLEADKAFGNAALYLEKYLSGGRHIEFQILIDAFGHAVHLGERECSIQRHHQKLLEESPSPAIDAATRDDLGARTARALCDLGYRNAGTVEFLRARDGSLYFMEVNARLQVEHPVTEMITGIDIVEEQIRIAANEPLRHAQDGIRRTGHAIELRINAEDPDEGFRPDPGLLRSVEAPPEALGGARVRWDSAARAGWRIPPHYDSMIGKLIVHAADRASAIAGAREALTHLRLDGVKTTIPLHRRILEDPVFAAGEYDVAFLETRGLVAGPARS